MTSRLDRLFLLLEGGTGAAARRAAADQLGELQRSHPEELHRLLARLTPYLRHPVWETRTAAAQAVEAILSNVPEWNPPESETAEDTAEDEESAAPALLTMEQFDAQRLLRDAAQLAACEGSAFDVDEQPLSAADQSERLRQQHAALAARLGLGAGGLGPGALGVDVAAVCSAEDLAPAPAAPAAPRALPLEEVLSKPLSSRERNVAKRRARLALCKQKSTEERPAEPEPKKMKVEPEEYVADPSAPTPDLSGAWPATDAWPLQAWCGLLQAQLSAAGWEARHGAAAALRGLLRARVVGGAGRRPRRTREQNDSSHQDWLEDMSVRLLCVLALDRFGDFVSDQVVAPVRASAACALGVCAARAAAGRLRALLAHVRRLAAAAPWESRHGALLAAQCVLLARQDISISCGLLELLVAGLSDAAEDVSCVAAAALVPAAAALAAHRPALVQVVVSRVCALLGALDELAAPAQAYMSLLHALATLPDEDLIAPADLDATLELLTPFISHASRGVRLAALHTLRSLAARCAVTPRTLLVLPRVFLRHRDAQREIQQAAIEVWQSLVRHAPLSALLPAACPWLARWLCIAMQDPAPETQERRRACEEPGAAEYAGEPAAETDVMRARCNAADMLGYLSVYLVQPAPGIDYSREEESPIDCYVKVLLVHIRSTSAVQRLVVSLVIAAWARYTVELDLYPPGVLGASETNGAAPPASERDDNTAAVTSSLTSSQDAATTASPQCSEDKVPEGDGDADVDERPRESERANAIASLAPPVLVDALHTALSQSLYYDEIAFQCNRVLQEARDLVAMMKHYKLPVDGEEYSNMMRLEQVVSMTGATEPLVRSMKSRRAAGTLEARRARLATDAAACRRDQARLHVAVQAALAGACAALARPPARLNPVVRPLMEALKREASAPLQARAARALAALLDLLAPLPAGPNAKVVANLKAYLRSDPDQFARVSLSPQSEESSDGGSSDAEPRPRRAPPRVDKYNGILTLWQQQVSAEKSTPRRGRPPAAPAPADPAAPAPPLAPLAPLGVDVHGIINDKEPPPPEKLQAAGATLALRCIAERLGPRLPARLPALWAYAAPPDDPDADLQTTDTEAAEELISRLLVSEVLHGALPAALARTVRGGPGRVLALHAHPLTAARHAAARLFAAMAAREPDAAMLLVVTELLPTLDDTSSDAARCGALELISRAVAALQLRAVPYAVLLLLPLLGRMSDHCAPVRLMASRCFAAVVQLLALDGARAEPPGLPPALRARRLQDRLFLDQLLNPKSIEDYKVPVPINAELRGYQQAGINWLRFLNKYQLHGVLCDDMGLGKTLQAAAAVASSHWERRRRRAPALPSLVLCPPTLTGHWVSEVGKFIPAAHLRPLQYAGPPGERERLRALVPHHNLVVASYDIVRKDIEYFREIRWNYCILDEGHVIKNGKTKAFKAVKQLVANHRLILSGTPIQNRVVEVWALFDWLMPGLLGSWRQFAAAHARPAPRDPRHAAAANAAAAEAAAQLHRQVLPFFLRRVKEDVLPELPPKITQDYYCQLSPLQRRLYEDFSQAHLPQGLSTRHAHVFQALHYLQNVCNHPKLVLTPEHPETGRVLAELAAARSDLADIEHSAKLPALKQLLLDCGIGAPADAGVVSPHRALIFCQLKKMLDIVERDLLRRHLPAVSYLRLDGGVPAARRHALVSRFNQDPTIDLLLLTTTVGGLGLNLTGADTVIFVEHDWNPTKDLQAMDRAHRLGQRRVVNVYRLITRDTIEEKIMGLQKFKILTANTVISSENASLQTMGTERLLDLFDKTPAAPGAPGAPGAPDDARALDSLQELWDERQYDEEYDMTNYIKGLADLK